MPLDDLANCLGQMTGLRTRYVRKKQVREHLQHAAVVVVKAVLRGLEHGSGLAEGVRVQRDLVSVVLIQRQTAVSQQHVLPRTTVAARDKRQENQRVMHHSEPRARRLLREMHTDAGVVALGLAAAVRAARVRLPLDTRCCSIRVDAALERVCAQLDRPVHSTRIGRNEHW